jgi:anti-sigma B factor antagonist
MKWVMALQTYVMTIDRLVVGHRTVLAVSGELDVASAPALRAEADAALEAGAYEVWIDLSATTFMDSAGVHLLVELQERSTELSRRLAIICAPGHVLRVLDLTHALSVLPIYADRAAAHRGA